ncbi:flagellar biosynthetic protein FliO [Treponema sp. OMZ 840]|uniref:FliO/MopB family protein n=1 Tax=Treponema sp. OMZ 840 TaxID=244313 RepID=UPI003D8DC897
MCFFLCIALCAAVPLAAQNTESGLSGSDTTIEKKLDSESIKSSEKDLPINPQVLSELSGAERTSTLWLFIRMILVLILVIACIYGLVFFLKKGLNPRVQENPFLKKAVSLTIAPGKSVHVLTMPGKAWLVGVGESSVNLIGEITDKELVDRLILEAEKTPAEKPKDFASVLNAFSAAAKQTESVLKKQRRRLEEGEGE